MNASGVSKACKSNDPFGESGKRERNTLVTYLCLGHNSGKLELIPDGLAVSWIASKGSPDREGPMAYQLVGEVMAHQGYDAYRV